MVKLRTFPTGTESTTNPHQHGQFDTSDHSYWVGEIDAAFVCSLLRKSKQCKHVQNVLSLDTEGSDQKILLRILRHCSKPFDIIIAEKVSKSLLEGEFGYSKLVVIGFNTIYVKPKQQKK